MALVAGCAGAPSAGSAPACGEGVVGTGAPLQIVTTVSPITNIVANVVGDSGAVVVGVVPEGRDSHTFEPTPGIAAALERADVVFMNGLGLEGSTRDLALANLRSGAEICELGTTVLPEQDYLYDVSFPRAGGNPNPHLWTDPTMVRRYARLVRDVLSARDPARADTYRANSARFERRIDDLDAAVRAATATVAPQQRVLLTYHDAYAYFAVEYGWTVLAAVQPSSFAEPSPRDVAALIEQIRSSAVAAVFGSEVFPSPVLRQLAAETGTRYVADLRDDDLPGRPGDRDHSWLAMMRTNFVTIVEALGGDASSLRALDVAPDVPDTARYSP